MSTPNPTTQHPSIARLLEAVAIPDATSHTVSPSSFYRLHESNNGWTPTVSIRDTTFAQEYQSEFLNPNTIVSPRDTMYAQGEFINTNTVIRKGRTSRYPEDLNTNVHELIDGGLIVNATGYANGREVSLSIRLGRYDRVGIEETQHTLLRKIRRIVEGTSSTEKAKIALKEIRRLRIEDLKNESN
jgi:hypothetical protein